MSRPDLKFLCPPTWCGQEKRPGLFVCMGCSRPHVCEREDVCLRYEEPIADPAEAPGVYG